MNVRVAGSIALLLAIAAWGVWLLSNAMSRADYVRLQADQAHPVPRCEWVKPAHPGLASLGLSLAPDHSWTDRATAYVAGWVPAMPSGGRLDLDFAAVAADDLIVDADAAASRIRIKRGRIATLELMPRPSGVLLITLDATNPKPPTGEDRRWLGAALVRLRVCPAHG